MNRPTWLITGALVALTVLLRLIPVTAGYSPMLLLALFTYPLLRNAKYSLLLPLVVQFLGDAALALQHGDREYLYHPGMLSVYLAYVLIWLSGLSFGKKVTVFSTTSYSLASVAIFFYVTNIQSWYVLAEYPKTFEGLQLALLAGLPFLQKTALGVLFFAPVFFLAHQYVRNAEANRSLAQARS